MNDLNNEFNFDGKNFYLKQGDGWLQLSNCHVADISYNNNFGYDDMGSVEISLNLVAYGNMQTVTEPPTEPPKPKKAKLVTPKQMGRILDLGR